MTTTEKKTAPKEDWVPMKDLRTKNGKTQRLYARRVLEDGCVISALFEWRDEGKA